MCELQIQCGKSYLRSDICLHGAHATYGAHALYRALYRQYLYWSALYIYLYNLPMYTRFGCRFTGVDIVHFITSCTSNAIYSDHIIDYRNCSQYSLNKAILNLCLNISIVFDNLM